jgi:hypothetical protein
MNREAAVRLASGGFWIFPCSWESKKPYHSLRYARNDIETVARQWAARPNALPAVNVGKCGLLIIDLDVGHQDGVDGVAAFDRLVKDWPECPVVRTPRRGLHVYTRQPEAEPYLSNSTTGLPAGIDIRADPRNGYVIGPGAIMSDGTFYELIAGSLDDIPECPLWFLDLIDHAVEQEIERASHEGEPAVISDKRRRAYALAALEGEALTLSCTPVGCRNHQLNKSAYKLGGHAPHISMGEAFDALYGAAVTNGYIGSRDPSDGIKQFRRTFLSGWKDGSAKPRRGPAPDPVNDLVIDLKVKG